MAASKDRNTQCRFLGPEYVNVPVKAAATIYEGTLVCVDSSGFAHAGADVAGYKVIGVAEEKSEAVTGESDGDRVIKVRTGVFKLVNSGSVPVVVATIGRLCYLNDDVTVGASDSNNVVAGIAMEIDEDLGIWVDVSNYAAFATVTGYMGWGAIETVTTGAIDPTKRQSKLSCTSTIGYTLADGTIEGQRKGLVCSVAASTPAGTVTPATGDVWTFSAVGEWVEYEWHASGGWLIVARGTLSGAAFTQTYSTADRTIAAITSHTITDSSTGTPSTSAIAAMTNPTLTDWNGSSVYPSAAQATAIDAILTALKNAVATLAAEQALIKADVLADKKNLNGLIDSCQASLIVK